MNILLCTDNNYVMPTGVLMHSISINNSSGICFFVFTNNTLTDKNRRSLVQISEKYGNNIRFFNVTNKVMETFPVGKDNQPKHISIAAYYRLFVSEIIPQDIHKVIYLDSDMIVRKSLEDLWNVDIKDYAIGAIHDGDEYKHCSGHRLPYPMEKGYFNSGMLLINLDYWRENNCYQNLLEFVNANSDVIVLHDQDVLNAVLYDSVKWLPITYNFQSNYVLQPSYYQCDEKYEEEVLQAKRDPAIIHFASNDKPWKIDCYHPFTSAWRHYWRKSEWSNMKLVGEEPKSLKELLRFYALRHNLYMPKCMYQRCILKK